MAGEAKKPKLKLKRGRAALLLLILVAIVLVIVFLGRSTGSGDVSFQYTGMVTELQPVDAVGSQVEAVVVVVSPITSDTSADTQSTDVQADYSGPAMVVLKRGCRIINRAGKVSADQLIGRQVQVHVDSQEEKDSGMPVFYCDVIFVESQ